MLLGFQINCWFKNHLNIYKDPTPFTSKHLQTIIRKFNYNQGKNKKNFSKEKTLSKNPSKIAKKIKKSIKKVT